MYCELFYDEIIFKLHNFYDPHHKCNYKILRENQLYHNHNDMIEYSYSNLSLLLQAHNIIVQCNLLGATAISSARFEEGTGPIVMDEVRCTGNEGRLMDCPLSLSHNCGHHQDAGVRCTLSTYGKQNLTESSPTPSSVIITI